MALTPVFSFASDEARRYRALFDLGPHACLVTDTAGRILEVNERAATLLGASPEELPGRLLSDLVSPEHRRALRARLGRVRAAGPRATEEWEARVRPARGEPFEAALSVALLPGDAATGPGFVFSLRDVTVTYRASEKLRDSVRHHRSLSAAVLDERDGLRALAARDSRAREAEALQVAREIHGDVAQMMAAAQLAIDQTVLDLPEALHERPLWIKALLDGMDNRLRRIVYELRPPFLDEGGLGPALGFLAESFSARAHVPVEIEGELGVLRFAAVTETALFRVVEEALANVARHARARRVRVRLENGEEWLGCSVRDDGVGFDPDAPRGKGLGLLGLRERVEGLGGRLEIVSSKAEGTELVATIPLPGGP